MKPHEDPVAVALSIKELMHEDVSAVARMEDGGSTIVFRAATPSGTWYVRIWPEETGTLAPEVQAHRELRRLKVRVPAVVAWSPLDARLGRSLMVTSEIPGRPLHKLQLSGASPDVVRDAGRELATLNGIPVRGFGWVRRDQTPEDALAAEFDSFAGWMEGHYAAPIAALLESGVLGAGETETLSRVWELVPTLFGQEAAYLAHGDFDTTHVYVNEGRYSGVIDFGEIRGAHRMYDLGHFWVDAPDRLPALMEGYESLHKLEPDATRRIAATGALVAARRLGRRLMSGRGVYDVDMAAISRATRVLSQ